MRIACIMFNRYSDASSRGLCNAFNELGHEAVILPPQRLVLPNLKRTFVRDPRVLEGFDVIIEINTARDDTIPKTTRHIAWIQDYGKGDPNRSYENNPMGKFVFIGHKLFDARAGEALSNELRELGHDAETIHHNRRSEVTADVIMEACHARDDSIPKDTVHIPWVHEYYGAGDPPYENALDHDLIYTFGDPDILGCCPRFKQWRGSLTMGVSPDLLQRPAIDPTLDFSIAGFMPPADWWHPRSLIPPNPKVGDGFNISAEITYMITDRMKTEFRPLYGEFDQLSEFAKYQADLRKLLDNNRWRFEETAFVEMAKYIAKNVHEYARFLNRHAAAQHILSVSQNVEFWGLHWDEWPVVAPYSRPFNDSPDELLNLYQRSRINVHDNIYGFALHSRVLEAMAVGGFVMAHESPHFGKAGQMTETFEPDVHFGQYNAESFAEEAHYWLHADRQRPIAEARKVIRDRHLWKHRAQQILDDLKI